MSTGLKRHKKLKPFFSLDIVLPLILLTKMSSSNLCAAVWEQNIDLAKALIADGADINAVNSISWTPLFIASFYNNTEIALALISAGANVNKINSDGQTPLHMATREGNIEIVRALIVAGADLNVVEDASFTPVYLASCYGHTEIVKTLIKAGANIHIANNTYTTPLRIASFYGHIDIVRALLDAGAHVTTDKNEDGHTMIQAAQICGHNKVVEMLRNAMYPPNKSNMSSVYVVIENGEPYKNVYTSFTSAATTVKEKYAEIIAEEKREMDGHPICSEIDVPENTLTGSTYLYVEKGIHIYIYKLAIAV